MANTKKSAAREIIIDRLLRDRRGYTAAEIAEKVNISVQKCSALLRQIEGLAVSEIKVKGKGKVKGYALA